MIYLVKKTCQKKNILWIELISLDDFVSPYYVEVVSESQGNTEEEYSDFEKLKARLTKLLTHQATVMHYFFRHIDSYVAINFLLGKRGHGDNLLTVQWGVYLDT
ncbi:hypothetical protein LOAG_11799 [Loa loa]|uniref:Uncharacterized protein n=1 Tax=Loa loa TaxID=7209 RepID=A0A1S0TMB0_LOALO|nr:hypothetical protein LOAG_11799 [Loa loa]EFO16706.1 hypothetical protein LOAG_11799 [Loa loa]